MTDVRRVKKILTGMVFLVVVMGVPACQDRRDTVDVRLRLEKDACHRLRMVSDQIITETVQGREKKTHQVEISAALQNV